MKFPKIVLAETDKPATDSVREGIAGALNGVSAVIEHPTKLVTKPQEGASRLFGWLADAVEPAEEKPAPKRKRRAKKS